MAASPRSLAITSAYRERLLAITARVERETRRRWPTIDNFDSQAEAWIQSTAAAVAGAQREAVRATGGYLSAYLTSELGRRTQGPPLDSRAYEQSRDGRPLEEALRSPLIGVRAALKDGKTAAEALRLGLVRALRTVELDTMQASRQALQDGMEADPRIKGWQRAVRGTCGACAGDIAVEVAVNLPSIPLRIHPNCMCVTQPVVIGVRDAFPLPTGQQIFERMDPAEQDEQFGADKAEALREGRVKLEDLVDESEMATEHNWITERPLDAVA